VGALARVHGNRIQIAASVFSIDGKEKLLAERSGHVQDAVMLAGETGEELLKNGAKKIEETWRTVYV
jgi:porphobilinogen deaminase